MPISVLHYGKAIFLLDCIFMSSANHHCSKNLQTSSRINWLAKWINTTLIRLALSFTIFIWGYVILPHSEEKWELTASKSTTEGWQITGNNSIKNYKYCRIYGYTCMCVAHGPPTSYLCLQGVILGVNGRATKVDVAFLHGDKPLLYSVGTGVSDARLLWTQLNTCILNPIQLLNRGEIWWLLMPQHRWFIIFIKLFPRALMPRSVDICYIS